jgi:trafficking protein particle complex subunit 9
LFINCVSAIIKLDFRNISSSIANNLSVSFHDSTRAVLEEALASTALAEEEAVELEYFLYDRPAFVWLQKSNSSMSIHPHGKEEISIEALGKRGLVHGTIFLEYSSDIMAKPFRYSRRIEVPLAITVNAALELIACDFTTFNSSATLVQGDEASNSRFVIVLEFRNAWINSLQLIIAVREGNSTRKILQSIQSGQTRRFAIDLPRFFLSTQQVESRLPRRNKERQFVVSSSSSSEALARKAWWHRERILNSLNAEWSEHLSGHRRGEVDLRGIRLSERQIPVVEMDGVGVEIHVTPLEQVLPLNIVFRLSVVIANLQGCALSVFI